MSVDIRVDMEGGGPLRPAYLIDLYMGATGIEPMTSTVSSTVKPTLDKGFSVLGGARARNITQENCDSAPWAHPREC
jgi:hypothetical protein